MITAFHPPATFSVRFVRVLMSPAGEKVRTAGEKPARRLRDQLPGPQSARTLAAAELLARHRLTPEHIAQQVLGLDGSSG
jgi:hypothetical protein